MKNNLCLYAKLVVSLFFQTYMYGMESNRTDILYTKITNSPIITNQKNIQQACVAIKNENDNKEICVGANLSATTIQTLTYATYLMDIKRGVGHNLLHELKKDKFINNSIANTERVTAAFQYFIDYKLPEHLVELIKMLKAKLFEIPILASTKAMTYLEECKLKCKDEFNISLQKNIVKDKVDIKTEYELIKLFLASHIPLLQAKFNAMEQEIAKNTFETTTKINQ